MMVEYKNRGVCSRASQFEVENGIVTHCRIVGGCQGNTQGVCRLVEGMKVEDVIARLSGIDCGGRGTSCPDQLARNLTAYMESQKQ